MDQNPQDNKEKKETSSLHTLRTLKTDASEAAKKGKTSLADLYKKQQATQKIESIKSSFFLNKKFLISVGVLLTTVLFLGVFLFLGKEEKETKITIETVPTPIIASQDENLIKTREDENLKTQLTNVFQKKFTPGDLVYFPILDFSTDKYLTSKDFLRELEANVPVFLTTFLENEFFLGLWVLQENHPALIFKIKDGEFDNAFSGILKWEKNIFEDIGFLSNKKVSKDEVLAFKDKIIKNQNVRILENAEGTVLLYSFFNKKFLIITEDTKTFEEIVRQFTLFGYN